MKPSFAAFADELCKIASLAGALGKAIGPESGIGKHLITHGHGYDLAGLGILGVPSVDVIQHELRKKGPADKRELAHAGLELGGLGTLAAPVAMQALKHVP